MKRYKAKWKGKYREQSCRLRRAELLVPVSDLGLAVSHLSMLCVTHNEKALGEESAVEVGPPKKSRELG